MYVDMNEGDKVYQQFSEKIIFQRKRPTILGLKMVEIFEILPNERWKGSTGTWKLY